MKPTSAPSGKSAAAADMAQAVIDSTATDQRNPELVKEFHAYMQRNALTNTTRDRTLIGRHLGYADGTAVYRYLAAKPEGDLTKFEQRLSAWLENQSRLEGGGQLVDDPQSFILPSMFAFLNQVRACGHIGVAHGPAGTGKSCAVKLYTAKHKSTTISIHLWKWTGGKGALVSELIRHTGITLGKGQCAETALARHFKDRGSMLILDNAQRLTPSARDWLADFLDFTGVAIALVGNPEIETQFSRIDQHKRRVGLRRDVSVDLFESKAALNTARATVAHLLRIHLPEAMDEPAVKDKALKLLTKKDSGACGALVMHAKLARLMLKGGRITSLSEAFDLAATQLITAA